MSGFGGSSISEELFNTIRLHVPRGSTILEFGSGWSTGELSKFYNMFSVENSEEWLNKYQSTYIHAPIVGPDGTSWYDPARVLAGMPADYKAILVDGHRYDWRLHGFIENIHMFSTKASWFFDDLQIKQVWDGVQEITKLTNKIPMKFMDGDKFYCVFLGDNC